MCDKPLPAHNRPEAIDSVPQDKGGGLHSEALLALSAMLPPGFSDPKELGFPNLGLVGFDQEAPYRSSGLVSDALHAINPKFGHHQTFDEEVRQSIENKLTPEQKKELAQERKETAKNLDKWLDGKAGSAFDGPPKSDSHLIDMVDVQKIHVEQEIAHSAFNSFSPATAKALAPLILDGDRDAEQLSHSQLNEYEKLLSQATQNYLKHEKPAA